MADPAVQALINQQDAAVAEMHALIDPYASWIPAEDAAAIAVVFARLDAVRAGMEALP